MTYTQQQLRNLLENITPFEWVQNGDVVTMDIGSFWCYTQANAQFIAAAQPIARQLLSALVRIEELDKENKQMKEFIESTDNAEPYRDFVHCG